MVHVFSLRVLKIPKGFVIAVPLENGAWWHFFRNSVTSQVNTSYDRGSKSE